MKNRKEERKTKHEKDQTEKGKKGEAPKRQKNKGKHR